MGEATASDSTRVTRLEILDHVEMAFTGPRPVTREDLLEQAVRSQARPSIIDQLRRLPDERYGDVRDLWEQLPDLPVGL